MTLNKDDCVDTRTIPQQRSLVFNFVQNQSVSFQTADWTELGFHIDLCVNGIPGAEYMGDLNLKKTDLVDESLHFTINDMFWGFLDDLYILPSRYEKLADKDNSYLIEIQM